MTIYDDLGLPKVINAAATLTKLGGSLMPRDVVDAMVEASSSFVPLEEMHVAVGDRIAQLTQNEAAYVSSGAAAGITLAIASVIAGSDAAIMAKFPHLDDVEKNEVIVVRTQRNGYMVAARNTGARMIEVEPTLEAYRAAFSPRTACVLWFAGKLSDGSPAIEECLAIAHDRGVPFIVDAAAQIPPVSNLWHFTKELGADIAIFSGGKGLRGPQSSGLVLGRRDIIEGCRANGSPNPFIGRPMKVGKEELAGCLAAVKWSLDQDWTEILAGYETVVHGWIEDASRFTNLTAERVFPSEAGQPMPRAWIRFAGGRAQRDAVVAELGKGAVRIEVSVDDDNGLYLNPQTLQPGDEEIVSKRLAEAIDATA